MEQARTAAGVPPIQTTEPKPEQDRDRIDWALLGIDLVAVVVLGAGLVTAFFGR